MGKRMRNGTLRPDPEVQLRARPGRLQCLVSQQDSGKAFKEQEVRGGQGEIKSGGEAHSGREGRELGKGNKSQTRSIPAPSCCSTRDMRMGRRQAASGWHHHGAHPR